MTRKNLTQLFFLQCFFLLTSTGYSAENFFFKTDQDYQKVKIIKVLNTDTIVLEEGKRVKLIGLRSPFSHKKRERLERNEYGMIIEPEVNPATPLEEQAFEFATELLLDQYIRLEFDSQKTTDTHDMYAYVFLKDGRFANTEILRYGFAHLQIKPPNTKYADQLRAAYKEARQERRGLQGE